MVFLTGNDLSVIDLKIFGTLFRLNTGLTSRSKLLEMQRKRELKTTAAFVSFVSVHTPRDTIEP